MNWEAKSLGELSDIAYGYTAKATTDEVGPKFLRITDLTDTGVSWRNVPFCPIDDEDFEKHQLQKDDIVFARTGATTGKSYLIADPPSSVAASYLIRLRLESDEVYPPFVALYFQTREYWDAINKGMSGAAQGGFNATKLKAMEIALPEVAEQKRIVSILDEAFSAIAKAKENAEKNLLSARELFESYLNRVFTQQGPGWQEKKLLDICHKVTVGHVGSMKDRYVPSGVPMLRSQNIRPFNVTLKNVVFIDEEFHAELKKSSLEPGDLAIVRTGYPGTAAVVPDSLPESNCSDLVIVKSDPDRANAHFLALFFNSEFGKRLVAGNLTGAAQKHFNVTAAKKVLIPFPPLGQQQTFADECLAFRRHAERLETIYTQKLANLDELKQSLLQKAFTGQLTKRAQILVEA